MTTARLGRLFSPRSIAVFGGAAAAEVVRQAVNIGYPGDIWPVHPHLPEMAGRRAFRSVADLPGTPDAAFIGVNRHASIGIVAELAQAGCGGAVMFASGYAEAGAEGKALQEALLHAANGMPFLGPNCYGFTNTFDRTLIWPDQFGGAPVSRGVAVIAQSGNIGLNITMQRRALPIGMLMTLGNMASVGHAEAIEAMLDDPRVTAIGLHMEGLGDPEALAHAVARAHRQGVPVVALKTGRSAAAASIALSHTASLGSSDALVDAYFRQIGVARVNSLAALLETLRLLHVQGPLPGRSIASLSCSGGEAALMADMAQAAGLTLQPLTTQAASAIAATVPDMVSVSNPFDYHTFAWRNREALAKVFAATLQAGADLTLLILDFPRPDICDTADWDIAAAALGDAVLATGRRAAVLATLPECMPERQANSLSEQGIVPLFGMHEALAAIAAAADCNSPKSVFRSLGLGGALPGAATTVAEWEGKRQLRQSGVPVPEGGCASTARDASAAAASIGFPVAVKATGDIAHKSELGAVRLNLADAGAVREAAAALLPLTGTVLVERMVTGCVAELIVGIARDPVLGPYLLLGSGGILAELIGDTASLLIPASRAELAEALAGLRVARLLDGFRNAPQGDIAAALDAILAIQEFAMKNLDSLHELEVNPLMVRAVGQGAVAADVLLRMTHA
jgi:acyl-CoA synthetase (NDP forming)